MNQKAIALSSGVVAAVLELCHVVIYTPECSQAPLQNAVLCALRLAILPAHDAF